MFKFTNKDWIQDTMLDLGKPFTHTKAQHFMEHLPSLLVNFNVWCLNYIRFIKNTKFLAVKSAFCLTLYNNPPRKKIYTTRDVSSRGARTARTASLGERVLPGSWRSFRGLPNHIQKMSYRKVLGSTVCIYIFIYIYMRISSHYVCIYYIYV